MKKIILYSLVIFTLLAGCAKKPPAPGGMTKKEVEYSVKQGTIEKKITETGECQPRTVVPLMAKISGKVAEFLVEEGDIVKEGQPLMYIYPDINEIQKINSIRRNYVIAQKDFNNIKVRYESNKDMLAKGFVSQSEYDEVEKNYISAKMAYENSKIEKDYLADVQEKKIDGSLVLSVNAPAAGTFYGKAVQDGEFIRSAMENYSSGTVLGYIGDLSNLQIVLDVDEIDYPLIKKGMPTRITFDAFPAVRTKGVVSYISLNAVRKNIFNQFTVKIDIAKNPKGLIKPGVSANAEIIVLEARDVLTIPLKAVLWEGPKTFVKLKAGEKKEVTLGKNDGSFIEVTEGLSKGDTVVYTDISRGMSSPGMHFRRK